MSASEKGFTLVETLAALAVAGLVAGGLLLLTGHWFVVWKSAARMLQSEDTTAALLLRLRADFGAAAARPDIETAFSGNSQSVRFFAPGTQGLEEVSWSANGGEILRASRIDAGAAWREAAAGSVAALSFEFLGDSGEWRSQWRARILPRAVRVTLQASRVADPYVMIAPLRARYPAVCARASSASTCDALTAGQPVGLPQPAAPARATRPGRAP